MAQKYGFFNSVNHDRTYDASDVAKYIAKYFTNGIFNNSMQVTANDNMTVSVAVGSANINGYGYENDEVLTLDINDADGTLSRIDSVIVRLDLTNRQITTQILEGSYASTPSQPTIVRTGNIYDLRLANILVSANTTRITATEITDTRFTSDCGNVVQAVQYLDTDDIFLQYQTAWNNWFANIQDQLDDNQAGHLQNEIGTLSNLTTTDKANLVSAINETKGLADTNNNSIGDLDNLNIADKSSLVAALNSINTYSTTPTVCGKWADGRLIYRVFVDYGNLPNNASKKVTTNIANVDFVTNIYGVRRNTNEYSPLPLYYSGNYYETLVLNYNDNTINGITIRTGSDRSSETAIVIIEYVGTSD